MPLSSEAAELAFWGSDADRWRLRMDGAQDALADSLEQTVAATPKALEWHVRRIYWAYEHQDGEALYAALLDLFIVLGNRGLALRRRLLAGARAVLDEADYEALEKIAYSGRIPPERMLRRAPPGARLCQGIEGRLELVAVSSAAERGVRDPLLEAREHIEYSQLEAARVLLETAVIENPEREDLHLELLSLYRAVRDEENFVRMREQLRQLLGSLPEAWAGPNLPVSGGKPS